MEGFLKGSNLLYKIVMQALKALLWSNLQAQNFQADIIFINCGLSHLATVLTSQENIDIYDDMFSLHLGSFLYYILPGNKIELIYFHLKRATLSTLPVIKENEFLLGQNTLVKLNTKKSIMNS